MENMKLSSCAHDKLRGDYASDLHKRVRLAAFVSVVISTAALLGSSLAVPAFYHYALTVNNMAEADYEYCRVRTANLWSQLLSYTKRWGPLGDNNDNRNLFRFSRKAVWSFVNPNLESNPNTKTAFEESFLHGPQFKEIDKLNFENDIDGIPRGEDAPPYAGFSGKCCTCQQGPPGPSGQSGPSGVDGLHGSTGTPGRPGEDAPPGFKPPPCQRFCPPGPPGQPGPLGEKGPNGVQGSDGQPGPVGPPGERGPPGTVGNEGPIGVPGDKGPPGESGRLIKQVAPQGPPGATGAPGPPGPSGLAGSNGKIGPQGVVGEIGDQGDMGFPGRPGLAGEPGPIGGVGQTGSCIHCPAPRLPPGY